jgi:hypothetical protein
MMLIGDIPAHNADLCVQEPLWLYLAPRLEQGSFKMTGAW